MKWISLVVAIALTPASWSRANECQQAKSILQSIRSEQRAGYAIKQGNKLACQERVTKRIIRQVCSKRKDKKDKKDKNSVRKQIAVKCAEH